MIRVIGETQAETISTVRDINDQAVDPDPIGAIKRNGGAGSGRTVSTCLQGIRMAIDGNGINSGGAWNDRNSNGAPVGSRHHIDHYRSTDAAGKRRHRSGKAVEIGTACRLCRIDRISAGGYERTGLARTSMGQTKKEQGKACP